MPIGVYPRTEYHRQRISDSLLGKRKNRTQPAWNKGLKIGRLSAETRQRMSIARTGAKNPSWRGGVSQDKQHLRESYRKWVENNRDRRLLTTNRRRVRKMNNGGSHTLEEWQNLKAQYHFTCACCRKSEPEIRLTRDHIVPLSKGGTDDIENIQPLCKPCNSRKYNKIISKYNYMTSEPKAKLKNSKPKPGQKLHHWIAQGGSPRAFNAANKTGQLRASSKQRLK